EVVGGGPVRRALVVVLEGGGEVGRQRRAVEVTGAQPGGADVVVGDDRHGELLHLRGAAPIVRVGLEGELFSLAPVGEDVGSGADRPGVEGPGVGVLLSGHVFRHDGQHGAGGEGRVGVVEGEDDLVLAVGPDLLDRVQFALGGVVG